MSRWLLWSLLCRVGAHLAATPALQPVFPAPERLMVDYLPSPALGVGNPNPLFTFSPLGLPAYRNVSVASARVIVVSATTGKVFWDSGEVAVNRSSWGIRCGATLPPGRAFSWTARWQASDGHDSAVSPPAHFFTDLYSRGAWGNAGWVGAGHGQFRAVFNLSSVDDVDALVFVASPGGVGDYVKRIGCQGQDQG